MGILSTIIAAAGLSGTLGGAIATVVGASVETGVAIGTIAGAGAGAVIGISEAEEVKNSLRECYY